eukprot:GHVT01062748.1.p1 GENE.GHVT01062748.1~~GHVT01062748.1.p1  ORF type:complete len:377 (+),score=82.35 GHVT01062748.1:586-1716(+)
MHAAMQGVGSFAGERVAFGARAPPRRSWLPSAAVRRLFLLASSAPLLLLAAGCRLACAGLAPEASGSPGGSPAAPAVGPKFHAPASVAARLPLPLPTYGECAAGAEYVITSTAQLLDGAIIAHLPCIFSVAEPPTRVPLGFLYGNLLSIANSGFYSPLVAQFYQGDFVVETKCSSGKTYYLNVLKVRGLPVATGIFYLGPLPARVSASEFCPEGPGLVMDFAVDLRALCPVEDAGQGASPFADFLFRPFLADLNSHVFPVNLFIDQARVVGRDEDGCILMLGRTFMRNPKAPEEPAVTAWFFSLKSCDPELNPNLLRGKPLRKIPTTQKFLHSGLETIIARGNLVNWLTAAAAGNEPITNSSATPWNNPIEQIPTV